jgi:hypothetical protein
LGLWNVIAGCGTARGCVRAPHPVGAHGPACEWFVVVGPARAVVRPKGPGVLPARVEGPGGGRSPDHSVRPNGPTIRRIAWVTRGMVGPRNGLVSNTGHPLLVDPQRPIPCPDLWAAEQRVVRDSSIAIHLAVFHNRWSRPQSPAPNPLPSRSRTPLGVLVVFGGRRPGVFASLDPRLISTTLLGSTDVTSSRHGSRSAVGSGRCAACDGPSGSTGGFDDHVSTMGLTPHARLGLRPTLARGLAAGQRRRTGSGSAASGERPA